MLLLVSSLLSTASGANVKKVTGSLKLTATVNHQPAFSSVIWQIKLRTPGVGHLVSIIGKHATTVELEPGSYEIILSVGSKKESRDITIVERQQHDLVININRGN
jgi:hypothetical protein